MSLPKNFYDPFVPTGEVARKRTLMLLPALRWGVWYPVIEAPSALGEPCRTLDGCCWLDVNGIPAHVFLHLLEVEALVTPR